MEIKCLLIYAEVNRKLRWGRNKAMHTGLGSNFGLTLVAGFQGQLPIHLVISTFLHREVLKNALYSLGVTASQYIRTT